MSEGDTFWIRLGERFFGLLLVIVAVVFLYFTVTSPDLAAFSWLFGFLGVIILILGIVLMIFRPPE